MIENPYKLKFPMSIDSAFVEWFVGFVDYEGTFSFSLSSNRCFGFSFKIPQSVYNERCLQYIQQTLNVGTITNDGPDNLQWRVRDKKILLDLIIPLFERYPLRTAKYYSFSIFQLALNTIGVRRTSLRTPRLARSASRGRKESLILSVRRASFPPPGGAESPPG
jgi:hypothetical protein